MDSLIGVPQDPLSFNYVHIDGEKRWIKINLQAPKDETPLVLVEIMKWLTLRQHKDIETLAKRYPSFRDQLEAMRQVFNEYAEKDLTELAERFPRHRESIMDLAWLIYGAEITGVSVVRYSQARGHFIEFTYTRKDPEERSVAT